MNKSSPTPNRIKWQIAILILVIVLLGAAVWKFQDVLGLKIQKINLTGIMPNRTLNPSKSIYETYQATSSTGSGDTYYTKLQDVICDAAVAPDGKKRYFRISVTFESKDKKNADTLIKSTKVLVEDLRDTVSGVSADAPNQAQVMSYIKDDLGRKLKDKFGDAAISGIYFEEIIKQ